MHGRERHCTLPSSEPDAIKESLKGFLANMTVIIFRPSESIQRCTHQSVSSTTAVWPRKRGNRSGALPVS